MLEIAYTFEVLTHQAETEGHGDDAGGISKLWNLLRGSNKEPETDVYFCRMRFAALKDFADFGQENRDMYPFKCDFEFFEVLRTK